MTPATLDTLRAAERYLNPAIALGLEFEAEGALLDPETVFQHEARIEYAIERAEAEIEETQRLLAALRRAAPSAGGAVPLGF